MSVAVRFVARRDPSAPLLVLFHDDGADERSVLRIGRKLWPGAPLASLRGQYGEKAGWRHLSESSREPASLDWESPSVDRLADAVAAAARREPQLIEIVAVGFGGGADAVCALLCRDPSSFAAAILCRPRRRWSVETLNGIVKVNGVEALILTGQDGLDFALIAKLMLSLAGHHAELKLVPQPDELDFCRVWLDDELRGADGLGDH